MTEAGSGSASAPRAEIDAGLRLLREGRLADASALVDRLLGAYANDPAVLRLACEVRLQADDAEAALALIERAIEAAPDDLALLGRKAQVLMALMRRADARAVAGQLAVRSGNDPRGVLEAGRICGRCDDPAGAAAYFTKARELGCDEPALLYDLAAAQSFLGQTVQAEDNLEVMLASAPESGHALYLRSTLRRQSVERNHVVDLQARLKAGFRDPTDAAGCLYALARELEDLEHWEASFDALHRGAKLKRATLRYDAARERAAIDRIRQAYTADVISGGARGHDEPGPVFIVGLPRTGTTLVERILARHPQAASAGELPYFSGALATAAGQRMREAGASDMVSASLDIDFTELGRRYLQGARQAVDMPALLVVDKMPANYMYCGLIRKALPRARIIHLVRDPMDACYAVYKTLFQQAYHFSYDLVELAEYYACYRRLMRHWHAAMPGGILDVRYEDLVTDPETQARRVLSWCGLEWAPSVLSSDAGIRPSTTASAVQVREPIHAGSVGKWRHCKDQLAPLRKRLADAGIEVES